LVVEFLDGEALVYDGETNGTHLLRGEAVAEFTAARDDVSRREVLRRMALAGVAAAGGGVLVQTIVSPTPAQAQSGQPCTPGGGCVAGLVCCNGICCTCCSPVTGGCDTCNLPGEACCSGVCCGQLFNSICCGDVGAQSCCSPNGCCESGSCTDQGATCLSGGTCCGGVCCATAGTCNGTSCPSDQTLKRDLAIADPAATLALV
jgi:hypothetical protein